jgi:hypothetical protein
VVDLVQSGIAFLLLCLNLGGVRPQFTPLGVARGSATRTQMCELLPDLPERQDAPDGGPHRLRVALALPALGVLVGRRGMRVVAPGNDAVPPIPRSSSRLAPLPLPIAAYLLAVFRATAPQPGGLAQDVQCGHRAVGSA